MSSLQALADIRQKIQETESKIAEVENASLPADDVAERIKAFVGGLQTRFDADYVGRCFTSPGSGTSTVDLLNACFQDSSAPDQHIVFAAWLHPDLLEQKLLKAAEPFIATGKQALPSDRRPALLKKLDETLSALLVDEEAAIVELEQAGHQVFRRAGIDPLVILAATD
jgi:hypothetical protein